MAQTFTRDQVEDLTQLVAESIRREQDETTKRLTAEMVKFTEELRGEIRALRAPPRNFLTRRVEGNNGGEWPLFELDESVDLENIVPEDHLLDEYAELAHRAVRAAEAMYPGGRGYAGSGTLGCIHHSKMPVLVELPDGDIAFVLYRGD
jgi:hypothetical protein